MNINELLKKKVAEAATSTPAPAVTTTTAPAAQPDLPQDDIPFGDAVDTAAAVNLAANMEAAAKAIPAPRKKKKDTLPVAVELDEDEDKPTAAVVPASDEHLPVVFAKQAPLGELIGDVTADDLRLPRIVPVHGVGDLSEVFTAGTITLDGEVVLADVERNAAGKQEGGAILVVPMRLAVVYRETLDWKIKEERLMIPREFATVDEVVQAGGEVNYVAGAGNFRKAMNCMFAIVRSPDDLPEALVPYFQEEVDGLVFCVALMRLAKSAYTAAGKTFVTDMARILSRRPGGMMSAYYVLKNTRSQMPDGDWVWKPSVQLVKDTTPDSLRTALQFYA